MDADAELVDKLSLLSVKDASNPESQDEQKTFDWQISEYAMNYRKKSKCYIFNHLTFDDNEEDDDDDENDDEDLNIRRGSNEDAARLYCRFHALNYDARIWRNFTVRQVIKKLKNVAQEDHSERGSFVCCVLSHGECGYLYAKDGMYPIKELFAPFQDDGCPTLLGKPKMFFIQACRGKKFDKGVKATFKESLDSRSEFDFPTEPDFLTAYSTVHGFYSWRNPASGSIFIQSLCAAIEQYANEKDLLSILTIVNRKVAYEFESRNKDPSMHGKKQVSSVTSSLTKTVRLS